MLYLLQEKGQGTTECALALVLVAIAVLAILLFLGPQIRHALTLVTSELQNILS